MSPKEAKEAANRAKAFLSRDAIELVGVMAQKHFKESFQRGVEGFTDTKLEKWPDIKESTKERKRRKNGSLTPILTDTGNLAESIDYNADYNAHAAIMSSDLPYAQVHNEGGGPKNMPQRQFMGPSKQLEEKIVDEIEKELDKIFGL